ncbi:hypothetical protein ACP70R_048505 [Stipagrostis hirtigluma subsp. patula]
MKDVPGSPGTPGGLALRASQCLCSLASLAAMATAFGFSNYSAFFFLVLSMFLELLWSFTLLCVDIHSLKHKTDLHNHGLILIFIMGDWIVAISSAATACSAAAVAIFLERDIKFCRVYQHVSCSQFKASVILAFMAWSFVAASATSNFFLFVSLLP